MVGTNESGRERELLFRSEKIILGYIWFLFLYNCTFLSRHNDAMCVWRVEIFRHLDVLSFNKEKEKHTNLFVINRPASLISIIQLGGAFTFHFLCFLITV